MMKKFFFFLLLAILLLVTSVIILKTNRDNKIQLDPIMRSNNSALIVIHLDRAVKRQENVARIFYEFNKIDTSKSFNKHLLKAIDGRQLSSKEVQSYYVKKLYKPYMPDNIHMPDNAVACFLSHRKAWQYIIDNNLDSALVFEDDARIDPQIFTEALKIGFRNLRKNSLIRFKYNKPRKIESLIGIYNDKIYYPLIAPPVTTAYLISKQTAIKLLNLSKTFDRPVDEFLKLANITGVYSAEVYPSGITEVSQNLGGSTIETRDKLSTLHRIKREIVRFFHRLQLL